MGGAAFAGADNFFDAGSCIDGRLTSAWNWCSKLEQKEYFPVFLLTGFTGFDGEFGALTLCQGLVATLQTADGGRHARRLTAFM